MSLCEQFESVVQQTIRRCYEMNYIPTRFQQMVERYGAVEVAKKLVKSSELQSGIGELARRGRLDLSMEQIMLEPRFEALFTEDERAMATG